MAGIRHRWIVDVPYKLLLGNLQKNVKFNHYMYDKSLKLVAYFYA